MSLILDEHRQYLSDTPRLAAFERAIAATVRPGDVVADIGCGTGILGLLACRAGAARVYAIDGGGMIQVARQAAAANGFGDRIVHLHGYSTRVDVPEPVDVLLADQIGRMGFEAGVVQVFEDARRRWLKPGGRVIPESTTTWVAPVEAPDLWDRVTFWEGRPCGFDFSGVREGAANTGYPWAFEPADLLGPGHPIVTFDLRQPAPAHGGAAGDVSMTITRSGTLHGLAGWFTSTLAANVSMTNAPGATDAIFRRNAYLPFDPPLPVSPGDEVNVRLSIRPADLIVSWRANLARDGQTLATRHGSTLRGMLVPREDLARTDPATRPRLTAWANARATVLVLCDGRHTLREVELETAARHPDLFPSGAAAQQFVAEVVTRYGALQPRPEC